MNTTRSAVLVGILVTIVIGLGSYFVSITGRKGFGADESYRVHMTFPDASGLEARTRVVIAGIDIGKVESKELVHGKALIVVRIGNAFALYEDASVTKRSGGLMGDPVLDIVPGTETKPRIPDGGELKNVIIASGMDEMMASAQKVADDAGKVTHSLAGSIGTDEGRAEIAKILKDMAETVTAVNRATLATTLQLAKIMGNVDRLTGQIGQFAPAQEKQIAAILENVRQITEQTRDAVAVVNKVVDAQQGQVGDAMKEVREALGKLNATLDSTQQIAHGIEKGQGIAGRLISDKDLGDKLAHTVSEASGYVDRLTGLKVEMGMDAYLGIQPFSGGKVGTTNVETLNVKIRPANSSRYYGIGLASDSQGNFTHTVSQQTIDGAPLTTVSDSYAATLRVSAYLAQMWGPATFRAGLIESTGGVGADVDLVPSVFALHADAFNFTPITATFPRVRAYATYTFLKNFDIFAGVDDILNSASGSPDPSGYLTGPGRSYYGGVGFHFTDDDLKAVLSVTGAPKM